MGKKAEITLIKFKGNLPKKKKKRGEKKKRRPVKRGFKGMAKRVE